jgi:hypothetical protein
MIRRLDGAERCRSEQVSGVQWGRGVRRRIGDRLNAPSASDPTDEPRPPVDTNAAVQWIGPVPSARGRERSLRARPARDFQAGKRYHVRVATAAEFLVESLELAEGERDDLAAQVPGVVEPPPSVSIENEAEIWRRAQVACESVAGVWPSQTQLVERFGRARGTISERMSISFEDGELDKKAVIRTFRTTALDGGTGPRRARAHNGGCAQVPRSDTGPQMTKQRLGPGRNCSVPPNSSTHESAKDCWIRCHIALEVRRLSMGSAAEAEGCRG